MPIDLQFERLFGGAPLISPTQNWWESGVTFNSAATLLSPTAQNLPAFQALMGPDVPQEEIVVLHYRARPAVDVGYGWTRSFVGVSLHRPDLTLLKRFENPVLSPGDSPSDEDFLGVEDPRVTWFEGSWWMFYCGIMPHYDIDPLKAWRGSVCVAKSADLVNWQKLGPVGGSGLGFGDRQADDQVSNKDGVMLPDRIDGKVVLLHRPMIGDIGTWCVNIATADQPQGPYADLGVVHGPLISGKYEKSWVGAGSVPIKVGEGRYLSLEHTGNYIKGLERCYVLDAFLYDFNGTEPGRPASIVTARMDDIMRPETEYEVGGPFRDSVANVVFVCGSYVHDGWLYLVYGGGDSFILAARTRLDRLVSELESRTNRLQPVTAGN